MSIFIYIYKQILMLFCWKNKYPTNIRLWITFRLCTIQWMKMNMKMSSIYLFDLFSMYLHAVDTYRKITCVTISCGCRLRFQNRCASFLGNAKLPKWAYLPKRYMFIVLDSTPTPHMDRMYDANVAIFMVNQTEESFSCHMTIHWIFTKYK